MKRVLWVAFNLFIYKAIANIEIGGPCYTSRNEYGICTIIRSCPYFVKLLRTQSKNPEAVKYMRSSTCGYIEQSPAVCCPQGDNIDESSFLSENIEDVQTRFMDLKVGLNSPSCGFSNVTNFRVVGGIPAKLHEIPFIATLGYENKRNPQTPRWLCAGSLITEKHVLTAAHCVFKRKDLYIIRFGDLDLYDDDDGAEPEDIKLVSTKVHEDYNPSLHVNDIGLITLERAPKHPWVWPICLPKDEPLRSTSFTKYSATVAGWGATEYHGPTSTNLQITQIPVVDLAKCKTAFIDSKNIIIDERVICAGRADGRQDACQGDSGGPLFWGEFAQDNLRYYLIGIVSYGYRCAEIGYPGVYTRITQFMDWVEKNTQ